VLHGDAAAQAAMRSMLRSLIVSAWSKNQCRPSKGMSG
jgi:hypothetical protein